MLCCCLLLVIGIVVARRNREPSDATAVSVSAPADDYFAVDEDGAVELDAIEEDAMSAVYGTSPDLGNIDDAIYADVADDEVLEIESLTESE